LKANYSTSGIWTDLNDIPKTQGQVIGTGHWRWGYYEYADMSYM